MARIGLRSEIDVTPFVPAGMFEYGIVESARRTAFLMLPTTERWEAFDNGTLFGQRGELRWRKRRNGLFHLVLILDRGGWCGWKTEELTVPSDTEGLPQRIVLWGEPQAGAAEPEWYEPRIPRVIREYPKAWRNHRVAIGLAHYLLSVRVPVPCPSIQCGQEGEVQAEEQIVVVSRFCDVHGV